MKPRVVARIQGHPSRKLLHDELREALKPFPTKVSLHESDPPSPWTGYQKAVAELPRCTHVVVLQDDVALCRNFVPAVERIADANPDTPVCLFISYLPRAQGVACLRAMKTGERYVQALFSNKFCPVVAILWPVAALERFIGWAQEEPRLPGGPGNVHSDDAVMGEWIRRRQEKVLIACPSLVEHPDQTRSTIGRRALWGKDKGRVALQWIGLGADPLELDWSQPLTV